jgi:hypothetical protein
MITDDGLSFHAVLAKADGATYTRETDNRGELLTWIRQHQDAGDTVVEIGMVARPPAVRGMLAALAFGAAKMATRETPS